MPETPAPEFGPEIRATAVLLPLPFAGPSATLFQLLGFLVEAGKGVASLQNVLTGDAAIANAPPSGATMWCSASTTRSRS